VKAADRIAAACISVGGVGTILAVSAVFLFLVSVVVPLLKPGDATERADVTVPPAPRVLQVGTDEYRVAAWTLGEDGMVRVFRLDNGDTVTTRRVVHADSLSAFSFDVESATFGIGQTDGTVRLGRVAFRTDYPSADEVGGVPAGAEPGSVFSAGDALVEVTADGTLRRQTLAVAADAVLPGVVVGPVRVMNHLGSAGGYVLAAAGASDTGHACD